MRSADRQLENLGGKVRGPDAVGREKRTLDSFVRNSGGGHPSGLPRYLQY